MSSRVKSREIAVELSFQMMINKESVEETIETFKESFDDNMNECDFGYIANVLNGIENHTEELDELIKSSLENWTIERISKVNHAILRVALYEIKYDEDVPANVAINEAIKIAKKYSDEKSASFINGILDKISKNN